MANQEHVDILRQGVEAWNTWRQVRPDVIPDLSGADLNYASLRGSNLFRANLCDTYLFRADLCDASLDNTNLNGTDLRGADLNHASLRGANLRGAIPSNADFTNATVGWTDFVNVNLSATRGLNTVKHEGPSSIGIDTIYKSGGNIPEVFLRGAGVPETFITYSRSLVNSPIEYYTCFISYSSRDQAFAERLYNDLQANNVRCWYAPEDMNIGDKIRPRIDESIRLYDKLLVILSENSIASDWVAYEVERALNKEPKRVPNVLYPIRLDNAVLTCTALWAQDIRETRHIGDFEQWKDHDHYQEGFKRLLRALTTKQPTKET